jgi:bifunctional ADP-heptose synthase (sugar kinase/adenylyltransferase)
LQVSPPPGTGIQTVPVPAADAVVLEDYNKGILVPRVIHEAIDLAAARAIPVVVDPKFKNFFAYMGATVFSRTGGSSRPR